MLQTITNVKTLKQRLAYDRELRGLSQAQLAKASKCSQGAIANVESGERQTLRNVVLVARALRVSSDWLFDGHGAGPTRGPALHDSQPQAFQPLPAYGASDTWQSWPFSVSQARFMALNPTQRELVDVYLRGMVDSNEARLQKNKQ